MSKAFVRLSWITLVFIYLVVIAGSVVRSSGSGMGCPDWPKCFDQVIPPTDVSQLPENYEEKYVEKRQQKVNKFARLLDGIGLPEVSRQLLEDESLYEEQPFNWKKTWTEYGNRLVGFVSGNLVLLTLIWVLIKYRSRRKLLFLAFINLIFMGFEAWLGSIVVATNLVPWVLTLHMFFALLIIWIQVSILQIAREKNGVNFKINKTFKWLFYFTIVLTVFQILLGSQVRQEIDFLVKDNIDRSQWISMQNIDFYIHRSLIWLVLLANLALFWINKKQKYGFTFINIVLGLIAVEFITGVLFSYAGMPAVLQPVHLLIASVLLGVQLFYLSQLKYKSDSLIR